MKGYKAFKKGMVCRDKQYEENTVFEEETANLCEAGMHFCGNPMDVLRYYPLVDDDCNITEFAEVESLGELKRDETKCCTNKIRIGKKLSLGDWIKSVVSFVMDKTKKDDSAQLASSGDYAQLASSGDYAKLASSGNSAQLASSGDYAKLASSGNYAKLASSGDYAQLASSGYFSQLASSGDCAVVAGIGADNIVKAKAGSFIVLAEYKYNSETNRTEPIDVKAVNVDGEKIKADTWYKLENGEFVETEVVS